MCFTLVSKRFLPVSSLLNFSLLDAKISLNQWMNNADFFKNMYVLLLNLLLSHWVQPVIFCTVTFFLGHDMIEGVKQGLSYKWITNPCWILKNSWILTNIYKQPTMKLLGHLKWDSSYNGMRTVTQPPGISENSISAHPFYQYNTLGSLWGTENMPLFYK